MLTDTRMMDILIILRDLRVPNEVLTTLLDQHIRLKELERASAPDKADAARYRFLMQSDYPTCEALLRYEKVDLDPQIDALIAFNLSQDG